MKVGDHVQNVNRTDTVSPGPTVGNDAAEAAGCRPPMKSAARCAWLAAVKIARLSANHEPRHGRYYRGTIVVSFLAAPGRVERYLDGERMI
jgi:hypothetical protein